MATSLAAQLSRIAANSTHSLNLKAQKALHAQSLIFEPRIAASQSFDVIYTLCYEGFQELCLLDDRFLNFRRNLFSEQSQEEDRTQMTATQNAELDERLEEFLGLVGPRIRLSPAIKAIEWLIRRFRIHDYNITFLLTTFLPYHTLPIFTTLLSILPPNKIPDQYRFLHPYIRSLTPPNRHVIVYSATNNNSFFCLLNTYVLKIANARQGYPALLSFWAGVITEAVSGMLEKSKSGRKSVQAQKEQDVMLQLLPTLNEGLSMKSVPEFRIGCYMLLSVIAKKGNLDDKLLTAMMEAVALGWSEDTLLSGLICLSILAHERGPKKISRRLTKELIKINDLHKFLVEISKQRQVDRLANGLCLALVDRLSKTGNVKPLALVESVLKENILSDAQVAVIVKELLLAAHRIGDDIDVDCLVRRRLGRLLSALAECSGSTGSMIQGAIKNANMDMDELEMKLQANIRRTGILALESRDSTVEKKNVSLPKTVQSFNDLLASLSPIVIQDCSFLGDYNLGLYDQVCRAFITSASSTEDLDRFDKFPLLQRDFAFIRATYLTFYIRTWCGPYPVLVRAAALQMVTRLIQLSQQTTVDIQAVIPYIIVALKDRAEKVRRAAAKLVVELSGLYERGKGTEMKALATKWGFDILYGKGEKANAVKWLSVDHTTQFLHGVLIPSLEECVLDKLHLDIILENAFKGNKHSIEPSKRGSQTRLSHNFRAAISSFLSGHAIKTPVYSVKLSLLMALNKARKVGSNTRTSALLPILQHWIALDPSQRQKICQNEQIDLDEFNSEAVALVTANDIAGLECVGSFIKGGYTSENPSLVKAIFLRIRKIWPLLDGQIRISTAQILIDTIQWFTSESDKEVTLQAEAMDLLRTVDLSTDVLMFFLNRLPTAARLAEKPPATKRRRISHNKDTRTSMQDSKQLAGEIRKVAFILELIDSSNPKEHAALLGGLFNALAELQHFKFQIGSELGYLQGLVLSSLLSIMNAYKTDRVSKLDQSAVRADLLVDCVQRSTSPHVQNTALLLIASLAEATPELVLHSVMPIFTFMSSSVLRQDDEYSAHVIRKTIKEVIPPLITSLRKEKGNPVTGAAELLLSFVAAYEHVPEHRRKELFASLMQTLGAEDFLFALFAMLVDKHGATNDIATFAVDLSSGFDIDIQLQTILKIIDLITDAFQTKPTMSCVLLGSNESSTTEPHNIALTQLALLPHLLSQRQLIEQTGRLLERDDINASRIRDMYALLLEEILALANFLKDTTELYSMCGDVLESLLGLLTMGEFVKAVKILLEKPNEELSRKILLSFKLRVEQESQSDEVSRLAILSFLPQLTAIIQKSEDTLYKHIAVSCVDKIADKYGKKDLEAVEAAAQAIVSEHCLGQRDTKLRVMALLCIASLSEILREKIISILPIAIPIALDYILESVEAGCEDLKLHNAGYSLLSALMHRLPYMISDTHLDKLLSISNLSAEAKLNEGAVESRIQCLQLTAKQIEAKPMFIALERNWKNAAAAGALSLREYLDVLSTAIDHHSKANVTKHSAVLSSIVINAFDFRRQRSFSLEAKMPAEVMSEIENTVNRVALKMVYKFNDAAFRPVFVRLMEWASTGLSRKDTIGRIFRLQSTYAFLAVFFANLKSIVTSYAAYLLEDAVEVLQSVDIRNAEARELWVRVLRTLCECFKHDQDDFWQSPAHFDAITPALVSQFQHASALPLEDFLVPAIAELASAADSTDHHKQLNGAILKTMRSESASVRLMAVKCEYALTDRLGEEWLSMLPEMLPFISELQDDDDEVVERETHKWIVKIESVLGESLDSMLQ